jgi:hypothetical protein
VQPALTPRTTGQTRTLERLWRRTESRRSRSRPRWTRIDKRGKRSPHLSISTAVAQSAASTAGSCYRSGCRGASLRRPSAGRPGVGGWSPRRGGSCLRTYVSSSSDKFATGAPRRGRAVPAESGKTDHRASRSISVACEKRRSSAARGAEHRVHFIGAPRRDQREHLPAAWLAAASSRARTPADYFAPASTPPRGRSDRGQRTARLSVTFAPRRRGVTSRPPRVCRA